MTLDPATVIARRPGLLQSEVDGELVGLHVENSTCYGFNATATRVWALVETPMRFDEICVALEREFDVDSATCQSEVGGLLRELEKDDLLELREPGSSSEETAALE